MLKSETVEAGTGTVTTPYDKKGIAYDTDGKDYRESTVTQPGTVVSKDTGKKDTVEANGKVYEYAGKSEVEGADKLTYDKTHFNDIEAAVSPEGMHNKLGEIDYTKTKGKVYLVEETADGQYGKYVVADNGVTSDEDAVTKWQDGQADAKEFTKENVTLQEGDTVLVLDKDTYAVGQGKAVKKITKGTITFSVEGRIEVEKKERPYFSTYITDDYTFDGHELNHYYTPGVDGIYGTADDVEKTPSGNPTYALLGFGTGYSGSEVKNLATGDLYSYDYNLDKAHSSLKDILKNYTIANYKALEFLEGKATDATEREKVQAAKARLDAHLKTLEDDIQSGKVELGLIKTGSRAGEFVLHAPTDNTGFASSASNDKFKKMLADFPKIIGELTVTANEPTDTTELNNDKYREIRTTTVYKYTPDDYTPNAYIDVVTTKNIKEYDAYDSKPDFFIDLTIDEPDKVEEVTTLVNKGKVEIAADGTVTVTGDTKETDKKYIPTTTVGDKFIVTGETGERTRTRTTESATYTKKEIITPIRAYKVMGEAKPVVTHYYNLKITKEEAGEATATKQGSVVIKYVTTDGKQLKSETDKDNVTLETKTIVSLYSGETKVDERTDVKTVEQNYDTTPKQYPTLVDADTGFTYKYVGLKQGSPAASGKVVEGTTEVVYEYRLVSNEETAPSKSEVKKTGSVDVTYVFKSSNGEYKTLKTEVVKDKVVLEYEDTYVTYSGNVKVSERKATRTVDENYDTADKQYPTLKDPDTGFTYKYVRLKEGSASASGKVVEGNTHVVYEYTLVSEEEKTPSKSVATKTGSVDVKHVVINEDGSLKTLKEAEIVKNNVPLEYEDTYVTYSNGVKVSERKEKRAVTEKYDTTDKQYLTLKDEATGLVYKYVGLTSDSAPATGDVTEGEKHVIYSYTLDKQEETTPSKTVDTKGSVVVKYVDADGNEIKDAENVVTDAVVKTTKTYATKSGNVVLSTRDDVEEHVVAYDTQAAKEQTISKDGKKFKFYRVLPVDTKFNNVTEETGNVKEGVTTIVYQYDYIIPVDPTKPNEGEQNPPKPGDKIPNDPLNRTYEQAGLVKNVTRTIDYQYASGPKKGEKASESVVQTARFTRKAEMNARTGELAYEPWSAAQTLEKVISPVIDTYAVDKENVEALEVNSESKDTKELAQYTLNVRVIEHDADKDKKGTVILKFVDSNENPIASDVVLKDKITVALAKTVITGDKEETTYTLTNETYTAKAEETIEVDGIQFKLKRILPAGAKWNNAVKESGLVKEGLTTIVYQYTMQMSTPVVDVPEYTEPVGTVPNDAPVYDIPEFNGGVNGIPEVHEKPEFTGGVNPIDPPLLEVPELVIPLIPMEEMSDPRPVEKPKPKPTPKEDVTVIPADFSKQEEPKVKPEPKPVAEAPQANHEVVPQEEKAMLPNTGGGDNSVLSILGGLTLASVLGVSLSKRKED